MIKRLVPLLIGIVIAAIIGVIVMLSMKGNVAVLEPQGVVANQQKDLILFTVALGMLVIVPVFILLFAFAWRYRDSNKTAKYTPNVEGNKIIESIWWGIPVVIIVILSVVTVLSTHQLDPYKALASNKKPIAVEVVSLQWRWLFVYPELGIATINDLRFPQQTPVNFSIMGDSPMSAFWIPSLGSQIYAMNGMTSKLSLEADSIGEYRGTNTNISGEGYAKMNFTARSLSDDDFSLWVQSVKKTSDELDWERYRTLRKPTDNSAMQTFVLRDRNLTDRILAQYMDHGTSGTDSKRDAMHHEGMQH